MWKRFIASNMPSLAIGTSIPTFGVRSPTCSCAGTSSHVSKQVADSNTRLSIRWKARLEETLDSGRLSNKQDFGKS